MPHALASGAHDERQALSPFSTIYRGRRFSFMGAGQRLSKLLQFSFDLTSEMIHWMSLARRILRTTEHRQLQQRLLPTRARRGGLTRLRAPPSAPDIQSMSTEQTHAGAQDDELPPSVSPLGRCSIAPDDVASLDGDRRPRDLPGHKRSLVHAAAAEHALAEVRRITVTASRTATC